LTALFRDSAPQGRIPLSFDYVIAVELLDPSLEKISSNDTLAAKMDEDI
jgi:hypothetical protein